MSERINPLAPALAGSDEAILAAGRRVIAREAEALWALSHELDRPFLDAIDLLIATRRTIIVCGLGKSGHIASKVASTLTATGTPAAFLHASEAVHGDLGSLCPGDTLLILSNSGDTREFGVIVRRAKALAIPIIAVTSSAASPVAEAANVCVVLPGEDEACPYGSSPTTSTTMMLALGDAFAVTVMKLRGVTAAELQRLHPGGRLGLDLVTVDSFMHRGDALPLVPDTMAMAEVLAIVSAKGFGVAGVTDDRNRLCGIITDGDVRRHAANLAETSASEVMTRKPRTVSAGAMARDALSILSEARITALFVVDSAANPRVAGLVHIHDLLRLGIG